MFKYIFYHLNAIKINKKKIVMYKDVLSKIRAQMKTDNNIIDKPIWYLTS